MKVSNSRGWLEFLLLEQNTVLICILLPFRNLLMWQILMYLHDKILLINVCEKWSNPPVAVSLCMSVSLGWWASSRGAAGSVRLHGVRSREGDLSHGCQPAGHDTWQGERQPSEIRDYVFVFGCRFSLILFPFFSCFVLMICFCFLQKQIAADLFAGEEEEQSSADDLTPSVTSNTSDLLRRLQGNMKQNKVYLHTIWTLLSHLLCPLMYYLICLLTKPQVFLNSESFYAA